MKGSASLKLIFKFGLFQPASQRALGIRVHGSEGSGRFRLKEKLWRGEEWMGSACGVCRA